MKNKKRILSGLLAAALVVPLFAGSAQTAAAAEAAGKTLDVVFTHDTHSHLNSFSTVIDGESTEVGGFAKHQGAQRQRDGTYHAVHLHQESIWS